MIQSALALSSATHTLRHEPHRSGQAAVHCCLLNSRCLPCARHCLGACETAVMEPHWWSWGKRDIEMVPPSSQSRSLPGLHPSVEMRATASTSDVCSTHSPESLRLTRNNQTHAQRPSERYKDTKASENLCEFCPQRCSPCQFLCLITSPNT